MAGKVPSPATLQGRDEGVAGSVGELVPSAATSATGVATESTDLSLEEEAKLVYGVVFSLKNFVNKLTVNRTDGFIAYRTSNYKLHYYESPTGLKFVLNTDPTVHSSPMRQALHDIYSQIYVEYVVKNPLVKVDRNAIANEYFRTELNRFVAGLSVF